MCTITQTSCHTIIKNVFYYTEKNVRTEKKVTKYLGDAMKYFKRSSNVENTSVRNVSSYYSGEGCNTKIIQSEYRLGVYSIIHISL